MGKLSLDQRTGTPSTMRTDDITSGYEDYVTSVYLEDEPRLIWLPHVLLSVIMITLLLISFINFHMKNKDRYILRSMVRQESRESIHAGNGLSPHLKAVLKQNHQTEENGTPRGNSVGCSGSKRGSKTDGDDSKVKRSKAANGSDVTALRTIHESEESRSGRELNGSPVNMTPLLLEVTPSVMGRLNDRQSLIFEKRDSRQNLFTSGRQEKRWVPIREDGWQLTRSPSRNQLKSAPPPKPKLFSFTTPRFNDGGSRPISVNMWASRAGRTRDGSSGGGSSTRTGRTGIFHL